MLNRLKHIRRIFMRYDKTAVSYLVLLCLAVAKLWSSNFVYTP